MLFATVLSFDFVAIVGYYGGYVSDISIDIWKVLGAPIQVTTVQMFILAPLASLMPFHARMLFAWLKDRGGLINIRSRLEELNFKDEKQAQEWMFKRRRSVLHKIKKQTSKRYRLMRSITWSNSKKNTDNK